MKKKSSFKLLFFLLMCTNNLKKYYLKFNYVSIFGILFGILYMLFNLIK